MEKILIAGREEEIPFLLDALSGEFEILACSSWNNAETALEQDISLVICGAHFHDGRLYDFARLAKSGSGTGDIPFYGIVVNDADFSSRFIEPMRSTLKKVGAQGALDLAGLRRECGDVEASTMLRTAVESIVNDNTRRPCIGSLRSRAFHARHSSAAAAKKHA